MHTVSALLESKGGDVFAIDASESVLDAAKEMNRRHIGALVVMQDGRVAGIFTERDILKRIVAAGKDPRTTPVGKVMSEDVLTCTRATTIGEVQSTMRTKRIRHLPVVDDGHLVGMISIGDVNMAETESLVETVRSLEAYVTQG